VEGASTGAVNWGDGGRYAIHDPIARGGVGQVFLAHDTQLNRWVAIKRLHTGTSEEAEQRAEAAIHEARHLAALQHPNIVTVFDFLREGEDVLVVMEFIQGHTLQERAESSPLDAESFADFARQSLEGLVAAHSLGMVHRDIKPGNLMFAALPSGSAQLKILDFGTARIQPSPALQTTHQGGAVLGSVFCMAPEQFEQRPVDARTDLYALGCCCYFALTGRYPFVGESVSDVIFAHLQHSLIPLAGLRPDLPVALCDWVDRLMGRAPEDRPADGTTAIAGLRAALAQPAIPPRVTGAPPPPAVGRRTPPPSARTGPPAPGRPSAVNRPAPITRSVTPPLPPTQKSSPVWPWIAGAAALALLGVFFFWPKATRDEKPIVGQEAAPIFTPPPSTPANPAPAPLTPPPPSTAALASAALSEEIPTLAPNEREAAIRSEGKKVEVRGRIGRAGVNKAGTIRFLNFADSTRGDISLVFFMDQPGGGAFTEAGIAGFVGKEIRATGELTLFKGDPQIVIRDPSQIRTD